MLSRLSRLSRLASVTGITPGKLGPIVTIVYSRRYPALYAGVFGYLDDNF